MKETVPHIMIVEDEEPIVFSMSFVLRRKGYQVSAAQDGQQALDMLTEFMRADEVPDLLICDMNLPVLTGIELIQKMHEVGVMLPIVAVTGGATAEIIHNLKVNGCTSVVTKPFDTHLIIEIIEEILSSPDDK